MFLQNALSMCHEMTPARLDRVASLVDPGSIDEAFYATETASLRRRRLPADRVTWLVIRLALFRNQPIWQIVDQLDPHRGATP